MFTNIAHAQTIELPSGFTASLASSTNAQISNFSPLLLMIMGLLLAITAIGFLIRFLHHK